MSEAATVYAQALYGLAKEEGREETILQQLCTLCEAAAQQPQYLQLLSAPNISKQERCSLLDSGFRDKVDPYLLNFLKILIEKGYIRQLQGCCEAYQAAYYDDLGILQVQAVTAVPLTQDQIDRLTEKLRSVTGKTIALHHRTDPAVLGGVRLDYDGKRVDGTVQNRLETLHRLLKNTVL